MSDDIATIVFAIMLFGHGIAHAVASVNLVGQLGGRVKAGALEVRSWLLPSLSPRTAAALALVFWLPASVGFLVAFPALLDIAIGDWLWQAIVVLASLLSTAGIGLFTAIWPGGEARLRYLHVFLALAMNSIILVTQLVLGWPD